MQNYYQQNLEALRRKQLKDLASKGLITQEQLDAALGETPEPEVPEVPVSSLIRADGTIDWSAFTSDTPVEITPQQQFEFIRQDIEQRYKKAYGDPEPTLQKQLYNAASDPNLSHKERSNFQNKASKVTDEHNAAFLSLDSQTQNLAMTKISKGHSIDSALYGGFNLALLIIPVILIISVVIVLRTFWQSHLKTPITTTFTNALGISVATLGCLYQIGALVAPIVGIIFLIALIRSC